LRKSKFKAICPLIILALGMVIDHSRIFNFSLVPAICVLSLILFSLFLSARQVIFWSIVYILTVAGVLWKQRDRWETSSNNAEALVATRTIVASGAGLLACLYAMRRERDDATYSDVLQLFEQLPIPTITSDSDGWVVRMNAEALKLFGEATTPKKPFYEYFWDQSDKGNSIKNYIELANGNTQGTLHIDLGLMSEHGSAYSAKMMRIAVGTRNLVLTILDTPSQPALDEY
jgi:PAS domain-containing protein